MANNLYEVLSARRRAIKMSFDVLSEKTNIPVSTLKKIFTGVTTSPKLETVRAIAYAMDMTLNDLDGDAEATGLNAEESNLLSTFRLLDFHGKRLVRLIAENEAERCRDSMQLQAENNIVPIPRLISLQVYDDPAAAGAPLDATSASTRIDFPENVVPPDADYGVRISGDSMEPTIPDGCIVFVHKAQTAHNRDIVIAWVESEGGMVCKRAVCENDRLLRLESDNVMYLDIVGDRLNGLRIYGIVVGHAETK